MFLSFTMRGADVLRPVELALRQPFDGIGREVQGDMSESSDAEFRGAYWASPSGANIPWAPLVPFGSRPLGPILGGSQGRIARALRGGPGSIRRATGDKVTNGARVPYADTHRGGSGLDAGPGEVVIRPKRYRSDGSSYMGRFLGVNFGVWISERRLREGLRRRNRPFATDNPRLRKKIAERVQDNIVSKR